MTQGKQKGQPAARGATPDIGWQGLELGEQGVEVIGPDLILGFIAYDDDIRGAAVAAIVEQHTVAGCRHPRGERHDTAQVAAATGGKCHPRTMLAKDLVIDVHAAYVSNGHRFSSRLRGNMGIALEYGDHAPLAGICQRMSPQVKASELPSAGAAMLR